MAAVLNVYANTAFVGELKLNKERQFEFQYAESWIKDPEAYPLSIRLPLNAEVYLDKLARPFFENLLPEAQIRSLIARQFGISEKNIFKILENIGGECAGAISLFISDQLPAQSGNYELISEKALDNLVNELPKHPLMADRRLRLSLAGAQQKLPVYIKDDQFYLPKGLNVSSHILKTPILGFSNTVINEYFCMTLARNMGLPVPNLIMHKTEYPLYIIERFDRIMDTEGRLKRIHQEDFCQALGMLSDQKYESEGGPTLKNCFELIKTYSIIPAADIKNFLHWVIFNYLIGNSDAHGKNLAFLITKEGPRLSPFYDILCTQIYPELSDRYAMKIGGENRPKWIQKRHWERFSEDLNVKFTFVISVMEILIERYGIAIANTKQILTSLTDDQQKTVLKIIELSKKRIAHLTTVIESS